jgi:predicted RNase H-like HicB family nuclease
MMYKYAIEILCSEEDKGYIFVASELPGCSSFGETVEEVLEEIKIAIDLWIETAKKEGKAIPKPSLLCEITTAIGIFIFF